MTGPEGLRERWLWLLSWSGRVHMEAVSFCAFGWALHRLANKTGPCLGHWAAARTVSESNVVLRFGDFTEQ